VSSGCAVLRVPPPAAPSVPRTFEEVTSNKVWAKELHDVYGGEITDLDLIPGVMAEDFRRASPQRHSVPHLHPDGLPRLNSDRFFTDYFTTSLHPEA